MLVLTIAATVLAVALVYGYVHGARAVGGFGIRFPWPRSRDRRKHAQYTRLGDSPIWVPMRALKRRAERLLRARGRVRPGTTEA
jgi:hypothetical protein